MAGKRSAGLLLYRVGESGVEVLVAHMGGPLWARRDAAAWSVPKGEYVPPEEPRAAAGREFEEELGLPPPPGRYLPLGDARQAGGKGDRGQAGGGRPHQQIQVGAAEARGHCQQYAGAAQHRERAP
ncbi:NUDIX domain-containing protein, partial [Streptomyces pinistramenti]|uniref:NUDIX domain-containing protein n=1 Tax=Streptomyces pinistramenti TaxID=2884812 RepID=UPI001D071478